MNDETNGHKMLSLELLKRLKINSQSFVAILLIIYYEDLPCPCPSAALITFHKGTISVETIQIFYSVNLIFVENLSKCLHTFVPSQGTDCLLPTAHSNLIWVRPSITGW